MTVTHSRLRETSALPATLREPMTEAPPGMLKVPRKKPTADLNAGALVAGVLVSSRCRT